MNKLILSTVSVALVIFIVAAGLGIQNNLNLKTRYMPADIRYDITIPSNIWPDHYYVSAYDRPQPRSVYFPDGYWTYEPGKKPFCSPMWVFHVGELTLAEADYTVVEIIRDTAESS